MDWLEEVHEVSKDAESPRSFITWAAIVAAGSVVRKQVYIQKGNIYRLYPNLFVLIVGPSGVRKSFPIDLAKRLASIVNSTRVISGRNSIQAVINTLHKAYTLDRTLPLTDASGLLISGEFSNFIIADLSALTILTELFDTYFVEQWKNTLKHSNQETLNDVCLSLFGATNDDHFRDRILDKDIKGGFMARTLCVYENQMSQVNDLLDDTDALGIDWEKLAGRLVEIATLEGKMRFTDAAKAIYKHWYNIFAREQQPWDRTGISRRIHDHVLKVAMILSMIRRDDLVIDIEEMEAAFSLCLPIMRNTELIVRGKGKSDTGDLLAQFIDILTSRQGYSITRSEFLSLYYSDFNLKVFNEVVEHAEQARMVRSYMDGPDKVYKLSDDTITLHEELLKEEAD